jgi:uncharacterized protein YndB with AHSA1/START domain/DNA-binding transcriptional ArsR family regulator
MPADQLSLTFTALADPTHRSILTRLAEGEATVSELAEPFSVSLPAISRHLKVLERAGLIVRGREAQWRPCRMQAAVAHARGRPGWIDATRTCAGKDGKMSDGTPVAGAEQEVLITRIFDAPREQVFRAWTDPDELAAWYGPEQMETPRERISIDLRVGGRYELTMTQRAGDREFTIGYEIVELVEPELLGLRSDPVPGMYEPTVVRVEFHDHGARTRMTLGDGPYPGGAGHATGGYEAALAKLATHLAGEAR